MTGVARVISASPWPTNQIPEIDQNHQITINKG